MFEEGPLRRAVAASMALPALFQPVVIDGRALLDGGLVNPLPFDLLQGMADIVVAIDVAGAPMPSEKRDWPSATEALWAASFIFERTIIREKLKQRQPDVYIDAGTGHFQVLDFLKFNEILKRAEPAKERFKAQLLKVLTSETLTLADTPQLPQLRLIRNQSAGWDAAVRGSNKQGSGVAALAAAFFGKKRLEQLGSLLFADAVVDLRRMVAGRVRENPWTLRNATALWIRCTVIKPPDAGERDRRRAHGAGLQSDVEIAPLQPLGAERRARGADRQYLRMRGRIVELACTVTSRSQHLSRWRRSRPRPAPRRGRRRRALHQEPTPCGRGDGLVS